MVAGPCPVSRWRAERWYSSYDDRYLHDYRQITLVAGVKSARLRFTARPGAMVTGRVLTQDGKPVANARMELLPASDAARSPALLYPGNTASRRQLSLSWSGTGSYTISATA